jgi:hypothetical protein
MKIEWHLDMGEALDPDNLLGDITLSDAQTRLEERDTYIDSWLEALITGLQAVQAGQSISVDIPEEPAPLAFIPVGKGVHIAYRTSVLNVESLEELRRAVCIAAEVLLRQVAAVQGGESNPPINSIRDFVGKEREASGSLS